MSITVYAHLVMGMESKVVLMLQDVNALLEMMLMVRVLDALLGRIRIELILIVNHALETHTIQVLHSHEPN